MNGDLKYREDSERPPTSGWFVFCFASSFTFFASGGVQLSSSGSLLSFLLLHLLLFTS